MAIINKTVNLVFGGALIILAAVAAVSMYRNWDLPVIREAPATDPGAASGLPQNHPPLETSNRLAALEQLSRSDPQNAEIKTQIGNVYYDMGRFQKAAEAYEESLKLKPRDPGVETDLATCYHQLGQNDRALSLLENVLAYQPSFAQAMFNKGIILQVGKNDIKGAIAVWEKLLQTNPEYPQKAELEQKINQLKSTTR